MAKKYIKDNEGIVRAVTSDNLGLEKPLLNENYDIEVHNRNLDKIDSAIQEVKGKIDGLELVASNVKMADGTTVEVTVSTNKTNISNLQSNVSSLQSEINGQRLRGINIANTLLFIFDKRRHTPYEIYHAAINAIKIKSGMNGAYFIIEIIAPRAGKPCEAITMVAVWSRVLTLLFFAPFRP